MKTEAVYDNGGEYIGDEYVNLHNLQGDTKKAILQMIYLDKTVDELTEQLNQIPST